MSRKLFKVIGASAVITAVLGVSACSGCANPIESIQSLFSQTSAANAETTANVTENTAETTSAAVEENTEKTSEEFIDAAGGNPVEVIENSIEVTVSEDKYIYDNLSRTLDEIMEIIKSADNLSAVIIHDQNATLSAYKALTDCLDERGISYTDEK